MEDVKNVYGVMGGMGYSCGLLGRVRSYTYWDPKLV